MVNKEGKTYCINQIIIIRKEDNMTIQFTKRNNLKNTITSRERSWVDLGYLGCEKDFPTVKYNLPLKKIRNTVLTEEQIEYNKNHSRQRVIIEHTICRIKKFCIMGTKYRNRLKRYDHISDIVSGLVNYRIMNSVSSP